MTAIEVVEKQNEIIKQQSELIAVLFSVAEQHAAIDDMEKRFREIEMLKESLNAER